MTIKEMTKEEFEQAIYEKGNSKGSYLGGNMQMLVTEFIESGAKYAEAELGKRTAASFQAGFNTAARGMKALCYCITSGGHAYIVRGQRHYTRSGRMYDKDNN